MPPSEEDLAWLRSTFHPVPRPTLPDDCVEYSLHIFSSQLDAANDSEVRLRLREVQRYATELQKKWLREYIWQRDGFGLEIIKEDASSLLRGRTVYGDSVEDEWVIVWLLRELSKKFEDLWVKVVDSDGEFLLIEAAGTLPKWLEPDVAENRVWIHGGGLTIVKPKTERKSSRRQDAETISVQDARRIILAGPQQLLRSTMMEEEAFYRLRNYPRQIQENMHHAMVTVPRNIAFLLRQKPAYISAAIEAFYLRDPIALKPLQTVNADKVVFKPDDLVTISVKCPRAGYAQLRSQQFPIPTLWKSKMPPTSSSKAYEGAETGMKIACGFEMLLSDPQNQDKPVVREINMLLDDVASGDEELPTNSEIEQWEQREDDDKWLHISYEDLEDELAGKGGGAGATHGKFGDQGAQENLQKIVAQFEKFLNDDKAGPDGAGLFDDDSDDDEEDVTDGEMGSEGEDAEASFDEDELTKMMQEMMGMPQDVMRELMGSSTRTKTGEVTALQQKGQVGRVDELDADNADDAGHDEDMEDMMRRMEAELNETGVLNLDPTPRKIEATRRTTKGKERAHVVRGDDSTDSEDGGENNIDVNLARNLLESFQSQAGASGPGGNLMGMMGLKLPRDDPGAEHLK